MEPAPPTQPTPACDQLGPSNHLYLAQTYGAQGYPSRELERNAKHRQRLQGQDQQAFEWPTKDFPVTPYDSVFKQHYPIQDSSHYSHYASFNPRGPVYAPYTSGGQFAPGVADWSMYYREDATRALTDAAVPAPGIYESWSNSNSNTSVSPVHSDSPITPV